ncbi:DUF805 domain-containing protein [Streptomyces sp. TRM72054]|uniref:DUF805 domain-containing protein n=1 Tax=Streptomyces sp. TRM72054 TaxID=2870562 RepID=UPI0027DEE429|nr:DUF805 domain-containing protein [Streptomyces sp. TRM72054]
MILVGCVRKTTAARRPECAVGVGQWTEQGVHDTGRTGWWILIGIVPLVGSIVLLVFLCLDGEAGANKYGENPKFVPAHA